MPFTEDVYYGWRVAKHFEGRNTNDGTQRWVEEFVVELVKGQRHIEAKGQDGIDPEIVLLRALTYGLHDDIREAQESGDLDLVNSLHLQLSEHETRREILENGWIARRIGTVFQATTINAGSGG